ncbi:MAG TPA: IS4 family transposase [Opitutaceae bacterium]
MHTKFLSQWLSNRTVVGHATRAAALVRVVRALLTGGKLSLTHLGRSLEGAAQTKHQIKAVDRLLGNRHLHGERDGIYRAIAQSLLIGNKRPVIIVDWSDFELGREWLMLKAALPTGGRAIALYEQVFPFKRYNSPGAHRDFLRALHSILPPDCRPIVVTDAGFRGPWFRAVEKYGWDWVGRIRNKIKYYRAETGRWRFTDSLYPEASTVPRYVGEVALSRRHRYVFRLYLVRAYKTRVGRPPRRGPKKPNTTMYRRLHRAPWLLATSLPHERGSERRIKHIYGLRMQIEETFRDLKCHRWGFGLRYARSNTAKRLEVLLLLGTLATLVVWLVGIAGRTLQWNWQLQANTVRKRNVLSTFFIGRQLLARSALDIPLPIFDLAFAALRQSLALAVPV